ncbi:MAG: hypothetical protein RL026_1557 [Pseudomonadota bacterium]|jgi:alpha-beta hydrolase superfamily lysophospholipase
MSTRRFRWISGPHGAIPATEHLPPEGVRTRARVILCNAGQVGRVGPQRLYVTAAEAWADAGIHVLRIDLAGTGDAVAENAARHFDGHDPLEAAAVVDAAGTDVPVVLAGLCAGARVALRAAAIRSNVAGVLTWGCPIVSSAPGSLKSPYETAETAKRAETDETRHAVRDAFRAGNLLRPDWLLRRVRYAPREMLALARALLGQFRTRPDARNPFLADLDRLVDSGRPLLFVYGQRDAPHFGEFVDLYRPRLTAPLQQDREIAFANHTFNSLHSQAEAIRHGREWLDSLLAGR